MKKNTSDYSLCIRKMTEYYYNQIPHFKHIDNNNLLCNLILINCYVFAHISYSKFKIKTIENFFSYY